MIEWINSAFEGNDAASTSKESYTSNMIYKLQLFIQEINGSLEETAQQVIATLPRLLKEVESLEDDARTIKAELARAKDELATDSESAAAIEKLTAMHSIKERMELYYKSAHDSGNGNEVSESEAPSIKSSENINDIIARISALNQQLQESESDSITSSPDILESSKEFDVTASDMKQQNPLQSDQAGNRDLER